ncbi:hypothetical protein [Amycolatopsis silviterrae]|uniref:DUF3558 domain-containing protein n=1 Tax=Amycolatopsis silviterrae TaxID=1656914 RepID=A0ABW5HAY4_9PSEU
MDRRIGGAGGGSDPGPGTGRLVAAAAVALVLAGGTSGVLGAGGTATETGTTSASSANAKDLGKRTNESKKSARSGKADEALNRMGMRALKKTVKRDLKCVAASTGQVRDFFLRAPCKSLDRILLAVGDTAGNSAVISVAWTSFANRTDADAFENLEAVQGSGDITPLAGALLGLAGIHFTGHHYQSHRDGTKVIIAETETIGGHVDDEVLDALAEVAVWLPKP